MRFQGLVVVGERWDFMRHSAVSFKRRILSGLRGEPAQRELKACSGRG
jgi:hypothetical protein